MLSTICFDLDQSKMLLSGNEIICTDFGMYAKPFETQEISCETLLFLDKLFSHKNKQEHCQC